MWDDGLGLADLIERLQAPPTLTAGPPKPRTPNPCAHLSECLQARRPSKGHPRDLCELHGLPPLLLPPRKISTAVVLGKSSEK